MAYKEPRNPVMKKDEVDKLLADLKLSNARHGCGKDKVKFTTERLNLPLFMLTRNHLQHEYGSAVRRGILKNAEMYAHQCQAETAPKTATHRRFEHLIGLRQPNLKSCPVQTISAYRPSFVKNMRWKLAPNHYDVSKEPFASRKGAEGAYIHKLHETQRRPPPKLKPGMINFYRRKPSSALPKRTCALRLVNMQSNARMRRASERNLLSQKMYCLQDRASPAPNHYYPQNYCIAANLDKPKKPKPYNPHVFHRYSSIPVPLHRSLVPKHVAFQPDPARYHAHFPITCPCSRKGVTFSPDFQRLYERNQRNKFRKLPYIKHMDRHFCSPQWRHVPGGGWRHLFKNAPPREASPMKRWDKKKLKHLDSRYFHMINNAPNRTVLSFRDQPLPQKPVRIFFNTMDKRGLKRPRLTRKIGFGSGAERFNDLDHARALTHSKLRLVLANIPPERRLRNYPTMRVKPSHIKPKLYEPNPSQWKVHLPRRKPTFKFLPLMRPRMLIRYEQIHSHGKEAFFYKKIEVKRFYKDECLDKATIKRLSATRKKRNKFSYTGVKLNTMFKLDA